MDETMGDQAPSADDPTQAGVPDVDEPAQRGVDQPSQRDIEPTGVAAADAAAARLRDVETAPLEEHVEIFDDVQRKLHDGLAELDTEQ